MPRRCIFYLPHRPKLCEVIQPIGTRPLPDDLLQILEDSYCDTGRYRECPLFQQLEQHLAEVNVSPRCLTAA
jgi:hypothetical protein